ncbi:MAG: hypothetical protein AAFO81_06200 [Pseudomonadota bacterium]
MLADIVVDKEKIELLDARLVRVKNSRGQVFVKIEGRLSTTGSLAASELSANKLVLGSNAGDENPRNGELLVSSPRGRGGASEVRVRHGAVQGKRASFEQVTCQKMSSSSVSVGPAATGESRTAGSIQVKSNTGRAGVTIQGSGDIRLAELGSLKAVIRKLERRIATLEARRR